MAIYQSLHNSPKGIKPNLQFSIAIKTIIAYHIMDKDFHELYNWLLPLLKNDDNEKIIELIIFKNLMRFKRVVQDCRLLGGDAISESDYFCGYQMVKNMLKKLKNKLIRWNIGPAQIKYLGDFEDFFSINKFEPIKYTKDML